MSVKKAQKFSSCEIKEFTTCYVASVNTTIYVTVVL